MNDDADSVVMNTAHAKASDNLKAVTQLTEGLLTSLREVRSLTEQYRVNGGDVAKLVRHFDALCNGKAQELMAECVDACRTYIDLRNIRDGEELTKQTEATGLLAVLAVKALRGKEKAET